MVFIVSNMAPLWLKKIIYFVHISYHFAQNENLFNNPPIEIFIISMKKLSFKENDITTLISEGGWASNDNKSSFGERPHANSE